MGRCRCLQMAVGGGKRRRRGEPSRLTFRAPRPSLLARPATICHPHYSASPRHPEHAPGGRTRPATAMQKALRGRTAGKGQKARSGQVSTLVPGGPQRGPSGSSGALNELLALLAGLPTPGSAAGPAQPPGEPSGSTVGGGSGLRSAAGCSSLPSARRSPAMWRRAPGRP
jgi:hypothetical protein